MRTLRTLLLVLTVSCAPDAPPDDTDSTAAINEGLQPPVATNPTPPFAYPPTLYAQGVEGTVILRLFVDDQGRLAADSTTVAEGSGHPRRDGVLGRLRPGGD